MQRRVPLPVQQPIVTSQLAGSVPSGTATPDTIALSLRDAVDRGLRYNLGVVVLEQSNRTAVAARLAALSGLLPNVTGRVTETSQQVNLKAFGFGGFPGVPTIVGPFEVFDARAALTQAVLDFSAIENYRGAGANERTARLSLETVRDAVVLSVIELYLRANAFAARVDTVAAQLRTSEAALQQARNMREAGVVAGIDVLRAQVQAQVQQQRLIAFRNDNERSLLDLARAIGLPPGQKFRLTDNVAFAPLPSVSLEEALQRAYTSRPDYRAALASESAALHLRRAAESERLPAVYLSANYGAIGPSPAESHGTYSASVGIQFPIFSGGRIRADVLRADALLSQRRAEVADLRGRIDYEVRNSLRDVQSARQQVDVAQSTVTLADQQLVQARDRFQAGVANNLEVVQAQESVAAANDNLISSLYAYNVAKASLAHATGEAQRAFEKYLGLNSR